MKHYAVIGSPIGHTMSPFIHNRLFDINSIKADYTAIEVSSQDLNTKFNTVLNKLDGFNVTIPNKQFIIPLLDDIDACAKLYGSVNTVKNTNGHFSGYTTDADGFVMALQSEQIRLDGSVIILGCGGVARVMAYECIKRGASITFAVRNQSMDKCRALCNDIRQNFATASVQVCDINTITVGADLLVNATPIGMHPNIDLCPVNDTVISRCGAVFDAIYNPLDTVLLQKARANGSVVCNGMSMLVYQAAKAQTIWEGVTFDKAEIDYICRLASAELANK